LELNIGIDEGAGDGNMNAQEILPGEDVVADEKHADVGGQDVLNGGHVIENGVRVTLTTGPTQHPTDYSLVP
jgi:hypothetical protein